MDKKKILVIEDDPAIVKILKFRLEKNYSLTDVSKKEDALNTLAQQKYDLIILDMKLPELKYGLDMFHQIKKEYKGIPIMILSVAADEPPVRDLQANEFVLKPFEIKKLEDKIKEVIK